jgi:predicted DNA-binding transcriptional regulator YafY
MPLAKNCNLRYQVLDHCLHSPDGMTLSQLREACNAKLELAGYYPIGQKSKNTILGDIEFMMNYYNAPIISYRNGRFIYYKYENPEFSIFKSTLPEEDLMKIQQTLQMLGSFEGRVNFEWVEEFKLKLNGILKNSNGITPVISFENNPELAGKEFITPLYDAIISKRAISITYKSFNAKEPEKTNVHPYYLKQYNNRWFLMCRTDGYDNITVRALDRIISIGPAPITYAPNTKVDFADFFDDMIGVTRKPDAEPLDVILWVKANTYPYVATKPLHWSQKVISRDDEGTTICIKVIPNYELEQLILYYGENVKVLSPLFLQEKIRHRIEYALLNYQTVQKD